MEVVSGTPKACTLTLTAEATMVWVPFLTFETLAGGIASVLIFPLVKCLDTSVNHHSNVDSMFQYLPLFVLIF